MSVPELATKYLFHKLRERLQDWQIDHRDQREWLQEDINWRPEFQKIELHIYIYFMQFYKIAYAYH